MNSSTNEDNVTNSMTEGTPYYIEITSGEYEGHRFDISAGHVNTVTIDTESEHNTMDEIPDLSNSHFVIRAHHTIGSLYRNDEYTKGYTQSSADQIHVYNGTGFDIYYNNLVGNWTKTDDRSYGNDVIIPPGVGVFVEHAEEDSVNVELRVGEVRYNDFVRPLSSDDTGLNHIAMGYPVDCTPDMLSMTSSDGTASEFSKEGSHRIKKWDESSEGQRGSYTTYSHSSSSDKWFSDDENQDSSGETLFGRGRSPFIEVSSDISEWKHSMPYNNGGWVQPATD